MTDIPAHSEQQPDLAGLRERFPGFFPPDDVQVKDFITTGMVAFDTNALLDVYRLNPQARGEYFAALRKLGDRLFVPYRVGQELLERRLTVIKECSTATEGFAADLGKAFEVVTQHIRSFGNRRGLSADQRAELERLATEARDAIKARAGEFYDFGMDLDASLKGDPILTELLRLLDGKVGPQVADLPAAEAEAKRRIENRIPPGFMDAKKDSDRAMGDYLIWRQILDRAAEAGKSVVLVTNDQKPDWAREDQGRKLGAHPDLVAEMMKECGLPFHLVSVQTFLVHAREYLGATVSDSTVSQTEVAAVAKIQEVASRLRLFNEIGEALRLDNRDEQNWSTPPAVRIVLELIRKGYLSDSDIYGAMIFAQDPEVEATRDFQLSYGDIHPRNIIIPKAEQGPS